MAVLDEYTSELEFAQKFFLEDLAKLRLTAGIIFGSSTYEEGFVHGVSDIDICIYSDVMNTLSAEAVAGIVEDINVDFIDKSPYIIDDNLGKRVEFYLRTSRVVFDITVFAPEIPNISKLETNACRDGIDMLIGALYVHGKTLFGIIPQQEYANRYLIPFYNDFIRHKRLLQLYNRLTAYSKRLQLLIQFKSQNVFDYAYTYRSYFIKWLFIFKRQYPLSLYKHLDFQLRKILRLSEAEVDILMFTGNQDLIGFASSLLRISSFYFEQYQEEVAI